MGDLAVATVVVAVPLVLLIFQRCISEGLLQGAVKE